MINVNNTLRPKAKQSDDNSIIEKFVFGMEHEKRLLERLSINEVAILSPGFHDTARGNKLLTPAQLVERVRSKLSEKHPQLVRYLDSYKEEAWAFATYVLEKINLPEEAQRELKQKQKAKYQNESMAIKEPTQKQLKFLTELGFEGSIQNRLEASHLISKLKGEKK